MKINNALLLTVVASFVFMTGCSGAGSEDLKEWVAVQKATVKPRIQVLKEPAVFAPQEYFSSSGMDPFNKIKLTQVLIRDSERNSANMALLLAEKNRKKEELESYPLDSMSMVGVLQKDGQNTALLRVNNLIYQAKRGNYIGQNYGRIVEISENNVRLREVVQDAAGDWVERITTLDLQEGNK